jgi:GDP-4-dehydro-6-deoxy-D-mannose reductase
MRVLVTGAAGFVGGYMLTELAGNGHDPVALYHQERPVGHPAVPWRQCDLLSRDSIDAALADTKPEACIHLAGIAFVPDGVAKPNSMLSVNAWGTVNLLDAFRALQPDSRVLCVSTAHVYGQCFRQKAVNEDSPLRPVTLYAISKAASDLAALGYAESWNMPVMTARPNNHTGPGQSSRFVIPGLLVQAQSIAAGKAPAVLRAGNMESERDFTDVRDVVRAYRLLIEKGTPGLAYNIGSGTCLSIGSIFERICRLLDIHPSIETDPGKFRAKDLSPCLDTARIREHTGWRPKIDLDETLRDMLKDLP